MMRGVMLSVLWMTRLLLRVMMATMMMMPRMRRVRVRVRVMTMAMVMMAMDANRATDLASPRCLVCAVYCTNQRNGMEIQSEQ